MTTIPRIVGHAPNPADLLPTCAECGEQLTADNVHTAPLLASACDVGDLVCRRCMAETMCMLCQVYLPRYATEPVRFTEQDTRLCVPCKRKWED